MSSLLNELNQIIDLHCEYEDHEIELFLGYKTFNSLMLEDAFVDHLSKSIDNSLSRYYKGVTLTVITEKHHMSIKQI